MKRIGWTNPVSDGLPDSLELNPPPPELIQSSSAWRDAVSEKRQEILTDRLQNLPATFNDRHQARQISNEVKIIDKSYLNKNCKPPQWNDTICDLSACFNLNREQDRAFRIVANHASTPDSEQLKMYIGGMGGTGKSQVLKALMELFKVKNESHRFIVVAPTGNAASLLGGSTYHYMFGINDKSATSNLVLAHVRERLIGVDYIFLDEISMLSCHDLFRIHERLVRVMDNSDAPFGGINMIFAGDFAQLPPAIGQENASLYSRAVGTFPSIPSHQEAAIGKALWHQVTTVVVLRQNMRQRHQTKEDTKFRDALSNMRYKACTPEDIAFLRSRISSELPGRASIKDKQFRNVSIITALNVHKDAINTIGCNRFSLESGQALHDFFSEDTLGSGTQERRNKKKYNTSKKMQMMSIPESVQNVLWNAPHSSTSEFIPGKLSLCIGLPVMIRNNTATELCITKGQEGTIYGWQASIGSRNQRILDTLFVKLLNPPQTVNIEGLPENVVPLTRTSVVIDCHLPDDSTIRVSRSQVHVIPNFSMTDYASQGKTREFNFVDLHNSRSHQAYYTVLSRSASAAGTLILQGFDPKKLTGNASGALRQEFRNLEILDYVTYLRYESKLPNYIYGEVRHEIVSAFRKWKGEHYIPATVHKAIRWNKADLFIEDSIVDIDWRCGLNDVSKSVKRNIVSGPCMNLINDSVDRPEQSCEQRNGKNDNDLIIDGNITNKRKLTGDTRNNEHQGNSAKKVKFTDTTDFNYDGQGFVPIGFSWWANSCAYDAVLTIIYNHWRERLTIGNDHLSDMNTDYLRYLIRGFHDSRENTESLHQFRDAFRRRLQRDWPNEFVWGEETSVHVLLDRILRSPTTVSTSRIICPAGHATNRVEVSSQSCCLTVLSRRCDNLQDYIDKCETQTATSCSHCGQLLLRKHRFEHAPPLLAVDLAGGKAILNEVLTIVISGEDWRYRIKGIVYHHDHHFTARFITHTSMVWYHDGMTTGSKLEYDGWWHAIPDVMRRGIMTATAVLYVRDM